MISKLVQLASKITRCPLDSELFFCFVRMDLSRATSGEVVGLRSERRRRRIQRAEQGVRKGAGSPLRGAHRRLFRTLGLSNPTPATSRTASERMLFFFIFLRGDLNRAADRRSMASSGVPPTLPKPGRRGRFLSAAACLPPRPVVYWTAEKAAHRAANHRLHRRNGHV